MPYTAIRQGTLIDLQPLRFFICDLIYIFTLSKQANR